MLVLSRNKDQRILIAEGLISIKVVDVQGNKVRLGIEAPEDIDILREELFDRIHSSQPSEEGTVDDHNDTEGSPAAEQAMVPVARERQQAPQLALP